MPSDDTRGTDLPRGHPLLEGLSGLLSMSTANLALGGSWVDLVLDAYMELLIGSDDSATKRLVSQHTQAMAPSRARVNALVDELAEMAPMNPDVIVKSQAWRSLESEVTEAVASYSPSAQRLIANGQATAVHLAAEAQDQAWTAMALDMDNPAVAAKWRKVPERAYADMVGRLQDGSPLSDLLDTLPNATSKEMRRGLLQGIVMGENAEVVGRRVAAATNLPLHRAVSISRTTIHSSYREASRRSYMANADLVDGWFWQSAHNERTCMACLMRDGTLYPLSEPMPAHARCRCRMRPRLRSGENTLRETGREWFDRQDPMTQLKMLGPGAHKAWKGGMIDLGDLAGFAVDPRWGAHSTRRPLGEAISFAKAGRPYHPNDFPPGWATPADRDVLELGAQVAFTRLQEAKAALASVPAAPAGVDDFVSCMGS